VSPGALIRYVRGAKWSVLGKTGTVLSTHMAHGQLMLAVDFGTEVYDCWSENVDFIFEPADSEYEVISLRPDPPDE
jgi:hypothetical protein